MGLNDLQEPPLERPSISSSTHRSSRRRPQYADPNQQLDEDSALHRLADLQHQPPRTRKAPSLVEAWDSNQGFRDENYQEASSIGLAELGTLTQKRHEALQAEEQNLIQHRTVAQSPTRDWVEDLTEILDLNHQEQAHLDAEIEELLHGRSRSKIMKRIGHVNAEKFKNGHGDLEGPDGLRGRCLDPGTNDKGTRTAIGRGHGRPSKGGERI